jgi:hypothetical protein
VLGLRLVALVPLAPVAEPEPDPELLPDEPPVEPSVVSTAVTRCGPGRNTICPSVTLPVCVSPSADCQRSTASVVAVCHVLLTVIAWLGSKPRLTRLRLSSCTSRPSVMPEDSVRYAGVVPSNNTTGAPLTV